MANDLDALRREIDGIDDEMVDLLVKRMAVSARVAEVKRQTGSTVLQSGRERAVLERVSERAGTELEGYARVMFATLMDVSRSYQTARLAPESELRAQVERAIADTPARFPDRATVACQGVEGAYSQIACDRLFPAANIVYMKGFEGVFDAVEQGLCPYGVLPIENSTYGTVGEVYDLMRAHRFHIARSVKLKIDHALLVNPGASLGDIREIFSHEQALGQCAAFLKTMPGVRITACENTAVAAKRVAESGRTDVASISSPSCAALYGLSVLNDRVSDCEGNFTRFICITRDMRIYPGANRLSILFSLSHRPGSLYRAVARFAALGLNLTKLESRPVPGRDFEFRFYLDLEASPAAPGLIETLADMAARPEGLTLLGWYQEV